MHNARSHADTHQRRFVPHIQARTVTPALIEQTHNKILAAEAKRARKNAKRAAAAKVGA